MNKKSKFNEIRNDVRKCGGFRVASMKELREAAGYSRLGCNVILEIQDQLSSRSVRWHPRLTANQNEMVWLYLQASPMQRILRFVSRPSESAYRRLKRMMK